MSSSATVLARDDVCRPRVGRAGRASSFLDLVFASFPLPLLRRKSTYIRSSSALVQFPADTVGFALNFREEQHHCNKAVRREALLAYVPNCQLFLRKFGAIFIITVYLTASANADPEARSHSPTSSSQALKPDSKPVTPEFRKHHDLLHQSELSILCVWRISAVYQAPCLCVVGFLNGSDKSSDTAFRYQGQRLVHQCAAREVCIAQQFHCCQGDRIPLDFALVHQRLRDC